MTDRPATRALSPRAVEIAAIAREILEKDGADAVTMRRLAEELGIRAPSLYKHFTNKQAVESVLIEAVLAEAGALAYEAVTNPGEDGPVINLLRVYREYCVAHPHLYRLVMNLHQHREALTPGLEQWAGRPWALAAGESYRGQALWAFAHGTVMLEIDGRFLEGSDLNRTWAAGAAAFAQTNRP